VPVNDFGISGLIADFDGLLLALVHTNERAGDLTVVGDGADVAFRRCFERIGCYFQQDIGRCLSMGGTSDCERGCRHARKLVEPSAGKHRCKHLYALTFHCWRFHSRDTNAIEEFRMHTS